MKRNVLNLCMVLFLLFTPTITSTEMGVSLIDLHLLTGAAAARGGLPSPWARVARAAGEGSRSEAEAWRDEANEL